MSVPVVVERDAGTNPVRPESARRHKVAEDCRRLCHVIVCDSDVDILKSRAQRMSRDTYIFSSLLLALAALGGCSSKPPAGETKKAGITLDRIQGKITVVYDPPGSGDGVLNGGGPSLYLWEGKRRYRLFFRKIADLTGGAEYIAEGVNAQKVIDDIGDPDQGKKGYPLLSSCERVVKMAWTNLPFDEIDAKAVSLRNRTSRYPARPIFLVVRIQPVPPDQKTKAAAPEKDIPIVSVPAEKQRASLIEGSAVQTAPLWEPKGGTVSCKVIIDSEGKIAELETGSQLCEAVQWSQFRYKPLVKGGRPVEVRTEVEARFEPRK